ncbi:MAG: MurR/RpiR family transcriptional regulator [Kiritimatiellae bacterium]|nr:MurR/RpiR family transcriptional regulator [Verrucomicrobiota bacterium]MCG2678935.1 MurR/RpiR family transcriptional regulator [Kiritimatiellia bacterium]
MTKHDDYRRLISRLYSKLGKRKKKIADALLDNPADVLNTKELAKACGCNQATVVRFAQQLGYAGYSELKLAIARQTGMPWQYFEDKKESRDHFRGLCSRLLRLNINAVKETLDNAKERLFKELTKKISRSKKVMICGAGSSRLAAEDLNVKLMRQGINTICFTDHELWKIFLGYLDRNDVLILFSHSGETAEIVSLAQTARKKRIYVAAITGFEGSSLAQLANGLFLTACSGEHSIRLGAMISRTAQSIIVDLITIVLSMRNKNRAWSFLEKSYEFIK